MKIPNDKLTHQKGFSLIELLVALLLSTALILGFSMAYASISGLVQTSKHLENTQEVLRYSAEVFTRSLKQTMEEPDVLVNKLTIRQSANSIACDGLIPTSDFTEIYTTSNNTLQCAVVIPPLGAPGTPKTLLTGIDTLTFERLNADTELLVSIFVKPQALSNETAIEAVKIDISLSGIILKNAMGL